MANRVVQRPDSRASTTSATSQQDLSVLSNAHEMKNNGYMGQDPEAALFQYSASMNAGHEPQQHFDASSYHPQSFQNQHPNLPYPSVGTPDIGFRPATNGMLPQQPQQQDPSEDRRRKGAAVTATNDKELREMLVRNEGRPLREVAQEVIQKERTPMAEKTKQLFAMLWLRAVCKPAKTSVPRNRVYSQYANRCGTERVVPLNPASFGKLVRVIFPGIQTRRLGVRGESKYHYVDLALEEEQTTAILSASWQGTNLQQSDSRQRSQSVSTQQLDFNSMPRLQADTAAFPANDGSFESQTTAFAAPPVGPASRGQTFVYPETRTMRPGSVEAASYSHTLRFSSGTLPAFSENEPVQLPSLQPYLPPRTDQDTAEALAALYRTHCTSLIDSIRFCKEKQFFRLYTSFHGTLTVPVQKLFTHPNLAHWIEQCDLVMYRTMVRFVSRLTLQAAPAVVINILSNISVSLHGHIAKTFSAQPQHVLDAKLRPATIFASLLNRLIRVNQSAHAAANLLTIDQNREQMWHEWATMVNPKRVMEAELPDCGYEEVHNIMTTEMRSLLEPLQAPNFQDDGIFGLESGTGGFAQFMQTQSASPSRNGASQVSAENVLDRWSAFLSSLPARFPEAPARTILHCISAVGTAALRDITIIGGQSYGHWWVLKLFVDEMALWMAEMGGFLNPASPQATANGGLVGLGLQSPSGENGFSGSHDGSRMSSLAPGGHGDASTQQPQQQPPQQQQQHHQQQHSHQQMFMPLSRSQSFNSRQQSTPPNGGIPFHAHHHRPMQMKALPQQQAVQTQMDDDIDDSGIGMSLMDDDLGMAKFDVTAAHAAMGMRVEGV